jgi:hypothetical protein
MMNENDEILMSQLADGELPSDQANELLLDVLDEPSEREKLKGLLRLRQATAGWRTSQPTQPVVIVAERPRTFRRNRLAWRMGSLAVAACVGGLLVLTGVWAAGWMGRAAGPGQQGQIAQGPGAALAAIQVTPEQMRQVAKVFALHESVAGPLAWYAADDQNIRLASARPAEAGRPLIAVLLRLESTSGTGIPVRGPSGLPLSSSPDHGRDGRGTHGQDAHATAARTIVIVCREDAPAVIELPAEMAGQAGLRVYLAPRSVDGKVDMRYAIAMDGQSRQAPFDTLRAAPIASISGQRSLGTAEAPLGQLVMGDRLMNVEAAAWPMRQEGNR